MVPALIRALLTRQVFPATNGKQVRDYVYVEDIANAFLTLLIQKATGIYNIGSGEPITVHRLMETIEDVVGEHGLIEFGALSYRDWDPSFICADVQKLSKLGWAPHYALQEGLRVTTQWWREQSAKEFK